MLDHNVVWLHQILSFCRQHCLVPSPSVPGAIHMLLNIESVIVAFLRCNNDKSCNK